VEVDFFGGEFVEVFNAAVVCVDDFSGDVPGCGGAIEGHDDARVVLIGVAFDVLALGAGHEEFAVEREASTRTLRGWLR